MSGDNGHRRGAPKWSENEVSVRGRTQCTATAKETGQRCEHSAVLGHDKCHLHGGRTPVKTGRYSRYLRGNLKDVLERHAAERVSDLREEVAVLRATLTRALEMWQQFHDKESTAGELTAMDLVRRTSREIRETVEIVSRIELRDALTPDQLNGLLQSMLRVLTSYVEPEILDILADSLVEMPWLGGTEIRTRRLVESEVVEGDNGT